MTKIRRALIFTSAERYTNLATNFVLIACVSRLLSPKEIGVSVIGTTILGFIEVLRDIPTPYIIQEKSLGRDGVATAFTCMLLLSIALCIALFTGAGLLSTWYGDPKLVPYCQLLAIGLLPGPIERPIMALMRRSMAFDILAVINVAGTAVNAVVAVSLAFAGFSFMSFAWAALAGNITCAVLALYFHRDLSAFVLRLTTWRRALALGGYSSAWAIVVRTPDLFSYLMLGRLLQMDAVGLYNRARVVNELPSKILMQGLSPVVFPALAVEARSGRSLKQPYLLALTIITALHWPAFLVLGLLAHPIVSVLLGPQWIGIVPLVQILALANMLSFSKVLTQPVLMAAGAFRDLLLSAVVALPIGIVLLVTGATFGLQAICWSIVVKVPIDVCIELRFVRRHVAFTWREFCLAISNSAIVTACTAVGPAILLATTGGGPAALTLAISATLACGGWIGGLFLTRHPLGKEIGLAASAIVRMFAEKLGTVGLRRKTTGRAG
jgi:O-antigen/teichoic acid export membrane protein